MQKGNAAIITGGADLLSALRFEILPTHSAVVVNLNSISALDHIKEEAGLLKTGALTRLEDIAKSPIVRAKYQALAEAAHRTASLHIREMETIGGNICQLIRCRCFRNPDNRFGRPTTPLKKGRTDALYSSKNA